MGEIEFPRLRPLEQVPGGGSDGRLLLRDPTGLAPGMLTLSGPTLFIASLMDGRHSVHDIQAHFIRRFGRMLFSDELAELVHALDENHFLDGAGFEVYHRKLVEDYRAAPFRPLRDAESLAAGHDDLGAFLDEMVGSAPSAERRVAGLVAPHLDYERGSPCYARAYRDLAQRTDARRFVILGTNHFGLSASVVGTRKDFETPWGVVPHDAAFMAALDERCGDDLCRGEFDHVREHSVELQVVLLKRVLGERAFTIVPYLCPDPCGPTGTRPADGEGVDLRTFAERLSELIAADPTPTCVIAGADLSHIGGFFGDSRTLDAPTLSAVEASDRAALRWIESQQPEGFRRAVARTANETHICSVGCIYAAATALLGRARPELRHYHQAVVREIDNCVTCAAIDFVD